MPLKLIPPTAARNKVFRVRGTYLGVYLDRSTQTAERTLAKKLLEAWKKQIECGEISGRPELTFTTAAVHYLNSGGGNRRALRSILKHFGDRIAAKDIDQAAIDEAAAAIFPHHTPATRNRQVYTPIVAVLNHAGIPVRIRRPKGAGGEQRRIWLRPEQFEALVLAAGRDREFAVFITLLCYTGLRLSEGLRLRCEDLNLAEREAFVGRTKNGESRLVYLPDRVIAALASHPRGVDRKGRLFRWAKSNVLYRLAEDVYAAAGVPTGGAPFHILRHTYGAWLTRAGADLVATGAWRSVSAARVYQHFVRREEAEKADLMPGAKVV